MPKAQTDRYFGTTLQMTINREYYTVATVTAFLMIFRSFPKIIQIVSKSRRTFPNIFQEFPKISEDVRRFPKIAEHFRGRPEDVSMIHQRI